MKAFLKIFLIIIVLAVVSGFTYWLVKTQPQWLNQVKTQATTWVEQVTKGDSGTKETALEHAAKHADPNYICPMHPQISQGEPGSCPICGMDLVKKDPPKPKPQFVETALEHAAKHADPNYICPMHPQISQGEPGSCPICGMDLVLKEPAQAAAAEEEGLPSIEIDPTTAQNMGIRTSLAKQGVLRTRIDTVGYLAWNEDGVQHVHARSSGWVETFKVKAEGDEVKKGDLLLEYYSPELLAAQKDFLISLDSGTLMSDKGKARLIESATNKLILLGLTPDLIKRIRRTKQAVNRIPIYAEQSGTVTHLNIRDGMYITPQTELYTITNLSEVWALVDVYEHQLSHVKQGARAIVQLAALGDENVSATVDYIYPELSQQTRSLRVRLRLENPNQQLKPNMFAKVQIFGKAHAGIIIPEEALIPMQAENRVVMIDDDGKYQPVAVKTGLRSDGKVLIEEGISGGDKIVVSGQFLIDSESNLQASFRRMME